MLELLESMSDEAYELLVLCMMYDVYRIESPRLWELMKILEREENNYELA